MRLFLEYASVVWDGCTYSLRETDFGTVTVRSRTNCYGFNQIYHNLKSYQKVSLSDRRKIQKLVFEAKNASVPEYLANTFPQAVSRTTNNLLRNN